MKFLKAFHAVLVLGVCGSIAACAVRSTETVMPAASSTPVMTVTPTNRAVTPTRGRPSATPRATPSPTATPLPTLTPLPTIAPQAAHAFIKDLIEKPACRLPCLWGIDPGVTTPAEALQFFESFSSRIKGSGFVNVNGHWVNSYSILFGEGNVLGGLLLTVKDGQVIELLTQTYSRRSEYQLSNLLFEFGRPDRVYIVTGTDTPAPPILFDLLVYYEEQRIIALYTYHAEVKGDAVVTCDLGKGPMLITSAAAEKWTESEITDVLDPNIDWEKPLEKVTDLTIDTFYERYKTGGGDRCITTPAKYWDYDRDD